MEKTFKVNVSYGRTTLVIAAIFIALQAFFFSHFSDVFDEPDSTSNGLIWQVWYYNSVFIIFIAILAYTVGSRTMTVRQILMKLISMILAPVAMVLAMFSVLMIIKTGSPSLDSLFWVVLEIGIAQVFCTFHILIMALEAPKQDD